MITKSIFEICELVQFGDMFCPDDAGGDKNKV